MTFTDEQFELLTKALPHFESARRERVRNAPRWLTEQTISIYEAATGKRMLHKNLSCAVCVLRVYQAVGKLYFDDLKNHQNNNFKDKLERENFEDLKNHQNNDKMTSDETKNIETKDNDTGSKTKKRNAKPKTGDKKKKE